jgi:hypothetical protein
MGGKGSGAKLKKRVFVPASGRQLFERQPKEGSKAWKCFVIYRDMGEDRSIARVREVLGESAGSQALLERWSARWGWRERCEAWENELDRVKRETDLQAVVQMRERHIKISTALIGLGATELNKWLAWVNDPQNTKTRSLTPSDVLKIVEAGITLERQSRGEPGSIVEERKKKEVDPDQVRARIDQLLKSRKFGK